MIHTKLVFVNPTEAFFAYLKIAMFMGFFVSLPFILYEIMMFVLPGLEKGEKKWAIILVPCVMLLFIVGVIFAYFVLIPVALRFFLSFGTSDLQPMLTIGSFISFVLTLIIVCGLIFQTPLTIFFLGLIGIVNSRLLREKRRYIIVAFFVISMLITPTPDAFTQIVVAIPLIGLYELGIFLVWLLEKGRKPKLPPAEEET